MLARRQLETSDEIKRTCAARIRSVAELAAADVVSAGTIGHADIAAPAGAERADAGNLPVVEHTTHHAAVAEHAAGLRQLVQVADHEHLLLDIAAIHGRRQRVVAVDQVVVAGVRVAVLAVRQRVAARHFESTGEPPAHLHLQRVVGGACGRLFHPDVVEPNQRPQERIGQRSGTQRGGRHGRVAVLRQESSARGNRIHVDALAGFSCPRADVRGIDDNLRADLTLHRGGKADVVRPVCVVPQNSAHVWYQ